MMPPKIRRHARCCVSSYIWQQHRYVRAFELEPETRSRHDWRGVDFPLYSISRYMYMQKTRPRYLQNMYKNAHPCCVVQMSDSRSHNFFNCLDLCFQTPTSTRGQVGSVPQKRCSHGRGCTSVWVWVVTPGDFSQKFRRVMCGAPSPSANPRRP